MFATAIIFFTRLPLWKWINVPSQNFQRVIYYWPFIGWITAGLMILVLLLSLNLFPASVAIILCIISRVLLTGALHEDGLADFLDGFGGGHTKEKILAIMKDSHAGTYAILGLILYFLLMFSIMSSLPTSVLIITLIIADPFCKMLACGITLRLPYARTAETSKMRAVYSKPTAQELIIAAFFGLMPFIFLLHLLPNYLLGLSIITPIIVFFSLTHWMKHKINGYTGDCAGALFLLLELSLLLSFIAIHTITS